MQPQSCIQVPSLCYFFYDESSNHVEKKLVFVLIRYSFVDNMRRTSWNRKPEAHFINFIIFSFMEFPLRLYQMQRN